MTKDFVVVDFPGKPQGKARPRFGNGRCYTPAKTKKYENAIAMAFKKEFSQRYRDQTPLALCQDKTVKVSIIAFHAVPVSWSRKRRLEALERPWACVCKPDLDNVAKIVLDALNGVAYDDDKRVVAFSASRHWVESHDQERVLINVEYSQTGGINE